MRLHTETIDVHTRKRELRDITREVQACIARSELRSGLCTVFVHHTSASLIISENADPDVRTDLEAFLTRLVPDGDPRYIHDAEGPDDMAAHVRSVLTATSLSVPVAAGRADLGTWQGIYLWEHRYAGHTRRVTVTILGVAP